MKIVSIFLVLACSTVFCQGQNIAKDTTKHIVSDTLKASTNQALITAPPTDPALSIYRASEPIVWDITNTLVALSFNWKEKTADAKEWIKLHPHFYSTDSVTLDAKGMYIDAVQLNWKLGTVNLKYS